VPVRGIKRSYPHQSSKTPSRDINREQRETNGGIWKNSSQKDRRLSRTNLEGQPKYGDDHLRKGESYREGVVRTKYSTEGGKEDSPKLKTQDVQDSVREDY